jgi:hypothetical protein
MTIITGPQPNQTPRTNTTNYWHPQETNLLNLHKAMEYNSLGQPVIRTTSGVAPTANDAFGRLRVSNPLTLFDSFYRYNDNQKFNNYTSGTATITSNSTSAMTAMTVGTTSGDKAYRESTRVFAYQPGKSLQIMTTFVMAPTKENLQQRVGYFDTQNGVYLEQSGSSITLNIRSNVSGSLQYETVSQTDWNADPLNGSGVSTLVLDLTKAQIFWIDIEWLGVGTVRCGFVIDGQFITAHQFHHANRIANTYMTTAVLPVRYEIENTESTDSAGTLYQICATVISEGGYELVGKPLSIGHTLSSPYVLSNSNVLYPIMSIRLKSDRLGAIVLPKNYSLGLTGNNNFRFVLILGGTTVGGGWFSAGTDSSVEYNLTGTSTSGGFIAEWKQIIGSNQFAGVVDLAQPFKYQLERNSFTGITTELSICLVTSGNNVNTYAAINWEEIT